MDPVVSLALLLFTYTIPHPTSVNLSVLYKTVNYANPLTQYAENAKLDTFYST